MNRQTLRALLISMRPKQWIKNVLIFTALVFDEKLLDPQALLNTVAGFMLFCLVSSTVYILNDITDLEADRSHPKKSSCSYW
jgi:4-hydroxybenzoate polyprenyltransferase